MPNSHVPKQFSPGIRGRLTVPNWLSNRRNLNVGFRVLWIFALMCDLLIQYMWEGFQAAMPGRGTPDALPYIGAGRGIVQGEAETPLHYAARLRAFLTTWLDAGSDVGVLTQIQQYLGNTPTVRIVTRNGWFTTIASNGAISRVQDTNWNWDSISNPERAHNWSDIWIIVYPAEWTTYINLTDPAWVAAWGKNAGNVLGSGHQVQQSTVDTILGIVRTWKAAHVFVRAIIWSQNPNYFVPGSLVFPAGNPDGTWGDWGYSSSPGATRIPARNNGNIFGQIRYWTPQDGA